MIPRYIPTIQCAKCGHLAERWTRRQTGNQRVIIAECHGEQVTVPFATEAGQTVRVFEENAA